MVEREGKLFLPCRKNTSKTQLMLAEAGLGWWPMTGGLRVKMMVGLLKMVSNTRNSGKLNLRLKVKSAKT